MAHSSPGLGGSRCSCPEMGEDENLRRARENSGVEGKAEKRDCESSEVGAPLLVAQFVGEHFVCVVNCLVAGRNDVWTGTFSHLSNTRASACLAEYAPAMCGEWEEVGLCCTRRQRPAPSDNLIFRELCHGCGTMHQRSDHVGGQDRGPNVTAKMCGEIESKTNLAAPSAHTRSLPAPRPQWQTRTMPRTHCALTISHRP